MDFEDWYRRTRPRIAASLAALTGADEAIDATDEAFARALSRWERVSAMASPEGWVFRVAMNVARRRARRAAIEVRLRPRLAREDAVDSADAVLPDGDLWALVRALPERQRTAVVLHYVGDLDQETVAAVMGVRRGTVASTLADARRTLGASLLEGTTDAGDGANATA